MFLSQVLEPRKQILGGDAEQAIPNAVRILQIVRLKVAMIEVAAIRVASELRIMT